MFEPAVDMPLGGIAVGPVDYPAFVIPFVLSVEVKPVAPADIFNPGGEIYIVGYQYRLVCTDADDDPLVPAPFDIVFEYFLNQSGSLDLKIALPVLEGGDNLSIISRGRASPRAKIIPLQETDDNEHREQDKYDCLSAFHSASSPTTLLMNIWIDWRY